MRPEIAALGSSSRFAAREVERTLFGPDPNHDLLRALQVGDSAPAGKEGMMVVNARVLTKRGLGDQGAPIEMEGIATDRSFTLPVKLDMTLLTSWAERAALPADGGDLLTRLAAVVQEHSTHRIAREIEWYKSIEAAGRITNFYRQLQGAKLGGSRCLIQLGWGTGWESKILGSRLRTDARAMERMINQYRMTRGVKVAPEPRHPYAARNLGHLRRRRRPVDRRRFV